MLYDLSNVTPHTMYRSDSLCVPNESAWFAFRCAAAAAIAFWLSDALGMHHTVWASMSALIVSQEKLGSTRSQVAGRINGTVIGALAALGVYHAAQLVHLHVAGQIAIAVAICAVIAKGRPTLRVCLWTCPLVLLTTSPTISPELTALSRTLEVFLGALVGGALHFAESAVLGRLYGSLESAAPNATASQVAHSRDQAPSD